MKFKNLTANSGLTVNNGNIQMGGPVQQNTDIQFNNYNITYSGVGRFGIGTAAPTSTLAIAGSIATSIRKTSTSGLVTDADHTVLANCTAGNVTLTFPSANTCAGRMYILIKTDETTNLLSFSPQPKISENNSLPSLNYNTRLVIQSDGNDWWIINQY